ncbi:M23/M56 family metallopeptidase [Roseivirga misakiensis]|uniref:Peptidase M23 domain-containing protein n=1 Tax=Roseivirga misakiensis TaxID=1563681 RepID=A0A1E5T5I5_9BACT|nr:M23/M56 family metallopeptidase [Roseivirga misakiensis]OEK06642.1 hypothetical protein BFP71_02955 [Roseivirga misakiensis]
MTHTILEIILCSLLFLSIYQLALAKSSLHRFKRYYLIFALCLTVIVPFITIKLPTTITPAYIKTKTYTKPIVNKIDRFTSKQTNDFVKPSQNQELSIDKEKLEAKTTTNSQAIPQGTFAIYILVSVVLLGRLGLNTFRLLRLAKKNPSIRHNDTRVILLPELTTPFSFFNSIYIYSRDFDQKENHSEILTHELAHVKQRHSIDVMITELFKAILWFNPFYYWFSKAIRQNHEYLADNEVIRKHKSISKYQKLLFEFVKRNQTSTFSMVSPFNYSFTQKRFIMMTKKNSRSSTIFKTVFTLLAICLVGMSFTLKPTNNQKLQDTEQDKNQVEIIYGKSVKPQISPVKLEEEGTKMILPFGATVGYGTPDMHDHEGVDFRAKRGTPVYATAAGLVVIASSNNERYGNFIRIKHNDTYESVYASLEALNVSKGETVSLGQMIGTVGNSIPESNIHLHYEVIKNGAQIDPDEYFFFTRDTEVVLSHSKITAEVNSYLLRTEFDMDKRETRLLMFSKESKYGKIIYDQNKILFVDHYEEVSKEMKMSDLSTTQLNALKGLKNGSFSLYTKRPSRDVTENWTNAEEFMVVIDGKITPNKELAIYTANDFSYFVKTKLRVNDPQKPKYRVDLYTNKVFDQLAEVKKKDNAELVSANNKLIEIIDP